jgi:hypothetical protein
MHNIGQPIPGDTMSDALSFTKLVPGFDFLQGLAKTAGAALPSIGQWVAPTLNPEELEKRIGELRTVQFWLEQNARMLGATIQALEVQRMTLSTLKTMNVQMGDLRDSLRIAMPGMPPAEAAPEPEPEPAPEAPRKVASKPVVQSGAEPAAPAIVDPMQWWGALTQQFTELAASAMKDNPAEAAKALAGTMVKQSLKAASPSPAPAGKAARKTAPRKPAR